MTEQLNPQVIEATQRTVEAIEAEIYEKRWKKVLGVVALTILVGPAAWAVGRFDQLANWLDRLANEGYSK